MVNLEEFRLQASENCAIINEENREEQLSKVNDILEYQIPLTSIQSLSLDVDFEPAIFALIPGMFPSVKNLTLNPSRVCCICPNVAEFCTSSLMIELNFQNLDSNFNANSMPNDNQQSVVPPPLSPAEAVPETIAQTNNIEFELDNCHHCFNQIINTVSDWKYLETLTIIGARCKDESMELLKNIKNLRTLSMTNCEEYSLKPLMTICYRIAKDRPDGESLTLKLNEKFFKRIISLSHKPANLFVINVSPMVDYEINRIV